MMGFSKKTLLIGLCCVLGAFFCVIGVLYFLAREQQAGAAAVRSLEERILAAKTEKEFAEKEAAQLRDKVGQSIYLEKLLTESGHYYGDEERARREGFLWIDRKTDTLLVTLGALNGVSAGSRLAVFDGDARVGFVRVETPLDVISYVYPVNDSPDTFKKDYYRVVLEQ